MAWTNLSFPFGSVLTSAQMTNLDANFEALAAGDSGAPKIELPALDDTIKPNVQNKSSDTDSSLGLTSYSNYLGDTFTVVHSGSTVEATAQVAIGSQTATGTVAARLTIGGTVVSTGSVDLTTTHDHVTIALAGQKTAVASGSQSIYIQVTRTTGATAAEAKNGAIRTQEIFV